MQPDDSNYIHHESQVAQLCPTLSDHRNCFSRVGVTDQVISQKEDWDDYCDSRLKEKWAR